MTEEPRVPEEPPASDPTDTDQPKVVPSSVRDDLRAQDARITLLEGKLTGARSMLSALLPLMAVVVSVGLLGGAYAAVSAIVESSVKDQVAEQIGDIVIALTETAGQATEVARESREVLAVATLVASDFQARQSDGQIYGPALSFLDPNFNSIFAPTNWVVVVEISEDLDTAQDRLRLLEEDGYPGRIYKLLDGFYTVAGPYPDLFEVQTVLEELRITTTSTAHLIDIESRCPQSELQEEGFYQCSFALSDVVLPAPPDG